MILLQLVCFGSYSQTNSNDSIKISINDVKVINQKLIDAKLVSEQLDIAKQMISNYKVQVDTLSVDIQNLDAKLDYTTNKFRREKQWKYFWCGTSASCISIIILMICL